MGHRERQLERFGQYNDELQFLLGISAITNRTPMIVTNRKAKNDGVHYPKKITVSPHGLSNGTAFHELGHRVVVEAGTPEFKQYYDRLGSTKKEIVRRMALLEITDEGVAEFIAMEAHYRKKLLADGQTELPLNYVYMAHINSKTASALSKRKKGDKRFTLKDVYQTKKQYQKNFHRFEEYVDVHWQGSLKKRIYVNANGEKENLNEILWETTYGFISYEIGFNFIRWSVDTLVTKHGFLIPDALRAILKFPPTTSDHLKNIPEYAQYVVDSLGSERRLAV